MSQIPFDLPFREAFEAEDFLVSGCNAAAVGWIDSWPDGSGGNCTIFYGPVGCGKTHLSHVWQYKSGAERIGIDQIDLGNIPANLIIEDIGFSTESRESQERLFHLYNRQKEKCGTLMLTARRHPKYWPLNLPDLQSRMLAAMTIDIGPPDDDLLVAVMVKQFMDRQITVSMEVIRYLLPRMERSFMSARSMVGKIDTMALAQKRKITIPLVRQLLNSEQKIGNIT